MFRTYRHVEMMDLEDRFGQKMSDALTEFMEHSCAGNDMSLAFYIDASNTIYCEDEQYLKVINDAMIELGGHAGEVIYIDFCW